MKLSPKIIFISSFCLAFLLGAFLYSAVLAAPVNITASVNLIPVCGDGNLDAGETCESGHPCAAGWICSSCVCTQTSPCTPSATVCGWGPCLEIAPGIYSQTGSCSNGCSSWTATQSCVIPVCGNGITETGEECDDGNTVSNDGCSATCQTEVGCGNNRVDPGEQCDDGNTNPGDCCSDTCQNELIINGVVAVPSQNSVTLTWQTACQITDSVLVWGTDPLNLASGTVSGLSGQTYSYTITGLNLNTIYHYKITASAGTLSNDHTGSFTTLALNVENCSNGIDDDLDGLIDLADPDCPCQAEYACDAWPTDCPPSLIKTRNCTKSNACWSDLPLPQTSLGCSPLCQKTCGSNQYLDLITCQCFDIVPYCGDGTCNAPAETSANCPIDCGTSGCVSEWQCDAWPEECPADFIQRRNCWDINNCEPQTSSTSTTQTCGGVCPGLTCERCQRIDVGPPCQCQELVPCCGNGVCEQGETYDLCRDDCIQLCTPNWTCSAWGSCAQGRQFRECADLNKCNLDLNRPPEVISCEPGCSVACSTCQQIDLANCQCLNISPCCGNRICEETETNLSCGVDCGLPPNVTFTLTQCLDGIDNDGDGAIDYPADESCKSPLDRSEEKIQETIQRVVTDITEAYQEAILENPQVQEANKAFLAPILVATVAVNTASGVSLLSLLSYLRYLLSQPIALIGRRRRAKWGVVFNSLTKQPIDLAIVRIYRKSDNRLVQSRVTDKLGRFMIMAEPGEYYISVTKPQYIFPTNYLKDKKEDVKFLDLYHGETVLVTEKRANITVNIPLDPTDDTRPVKKIVFQYYLRKFQYAAAFASVILAIVSLILSPGPLMLALLAFHLLLYILFRRLGYQKPPKSWGIVYDLDNKTPLARAITRIYDKQYNKLLETRVSDSKGRYSFLVNKNVYYVTTEKPGYNPHRTGDIDLIAKERDAYVDMDIALKKAGTASANQAPPAAPPQAPSAELQPEATPEISQPAQAAPAAETETVQTGVERQTLNELLEEKVQQRLRDEAAAAASPEPPKPEVPKPNIPEEKKPMDNPEKSIFG